MSIKLENTDFTAAWASLDAYINFDYVKENASKPILAEKVAVIGTPLAQRQHKPINHRNKLKEFFDKVTEPMDYHAPSGAYGISLFQYALTGRHIEIIAELLDELSDDYADLPAAYWNDCYTLAAQAFDHSDEDYDSDNYAIVLTLKKYTEITGRAQSKPSDVPAPFNYD